MMDLSPFDFFRQESSHHDVVVRTEAMNRIVYILALMEPEKVRSEMIPYLQTKSKEADQVLLALAHKIGYFIKYIGGVDYSPMLIPTIEYLCGAEETAVRTATSSSLNKILSQLSASHKAPAQEYLELFKRLANDENVDLFYSRISSCYMIGELYRISDPADRIIIRDTYSKLINDEIFLVKRSSASNLISLASYSEADILCNDLFIILKKMISDDLPTVRIIGVSSMISYIKLLQHHDKVKMISSDIISMIHVCYDDVSWKIRLAISKDYHLLYDCFDASSISSDIFPGVIQLLQDIEPDIRKNAVKSLSSYVNIIGSISFMNELSPMISSMLTDPVSEVRKLFAEAWIDITLKLSLEQINNHNIYDVIIKIMNDDDPLVRLRIISRLPMISSHIPSLSMKLTDIIKSCMIDINWRMRKGVVLILPALIKAFGVDYFIEHYHVLFLNILKDSVSEVRYACAEVVPQFISIHTSSSSMIASCIEFVYQQIFPTIKSMGNDEYVVRLSMLTAVDGLLMIKDLPENFRTEVVQLLVNASNDKVANIRLRAAQVMMSVGKCAYPDNVKSYIKLILGNLQSDKDKDVQYFTSIALQEFP